MIFKGNNYNKSNIMSKNICRYLKEKYMPSLLFDIKHYYQKGLIEITDSHQSKASEALYITIRYTDIDETFSFSIRNHDVVKDSNLDKAYFLYKVDYLEDLTKTILGDIDRFHDENSINAIKIRQEKAEKEKKKLIENNKIKKGLKLIHNEENDDPKEIKKDDNTNDNKHSSLSNSTEETTETIIKEKEDFSEEELSEEERKMLAQTMNRQMLQDKFQEFISNQDEIVGNINTFFALYSENSSIEAAQKLLYLLKLATGLTWQLRRYTQSSNYNIQSKNKFECYIPGKYNNEALIYALFNKETLSVFSHENEIDKKLHE